MSAGSDLNKNFVFYTLNIETINPP